MLIFHLKPSGSTHGNMVHGKMFLCFFCGTLCRSFLLHAVMERKMQPHKSHTHGPMAFVHAWSKHVLNCGPTLFFRTRDVLDWNMRSPWHRIRTYRCDFNILSQHFH